MRVGVNTLFLIPAEVGGSEVYLRETLRSIATDFPDIELVLFTNRENDEFFRVFLGGASRVEYYKLDFRATNRIARILREQIELPFRVGRSRVDLLWSGGYTAPLCAPRPQVVSIYDMQYKRHPEDFSLPARLATAILVSMAARRARRVMTLSNFSKEEILAHVAIPADLVHVTYPGVDARFADRPPEAELQQRISRLVPGGPPYLLCVAGSYPHKNLHFLVRSFGRVVGEIPHRLVLVGNPGRGESALQEALTCLGRSDRVVRLSHLSREDMIALYQGADLFVFPSLYEGFGIPVLEAMMAGIPVITTHRGAIPEVGGDCVRYFDETKEEDLADKIRQMIGLTHDQRKVWVERAMNRAIQFTWRRTAEQTVACFRAVAINC